MSDKPDYHPVVRNMGWLCEQDISEALASALRLHGSPECKALAWDFMQILRGETPANQPKSAIPETGEGG